MLRASPSGLTRILPRSILPCSTPHSRLAFVSSAIQLQRKPVSSSEHPPHKQQLVGINLDAGIAYEVEKVAVYDTMAHQDTTNTAPQKQTTVERLMAMLEAPVPPFAGEAALEVSSMQNLHPQAPDATLTTTNSDVHQTSEYFEVEPDADDSILPPRRKPRTGIVQPLQGTRVRRYRKRANACVAQLAAVQATNSPSSSTHHPVATYANLDTAKLVDQLSELALDEIPHHYLTREFRVTLLAIIGSTPSIDTAWNAYHALTLLPRPRTMRAYELSIPFAYIYRLIRLLSTARPRTRTVFLRLLSAVAALHQAGACIPQWQWSLLIDAAGKGWLRVRLEDFRNALYMYSDMVSGRAPGATFLHLGRSSPALDNDPHYALDGDEYDTGEIQDLHAGRKPDIVTFTTLLALAVKSGDARALRRASQLLTRSGLPPDASTHNVLFSHFLMQRERAGARETLHALQEFAHQHPGRVGQPEFAAMLWTFAKSGDLAVANAMYQLARSRAILHDDQRTAAWAARLEELEPLVSVPPDARPDQAVYHMMIQANAYRGNFSACLRVFTDMLSDPSPSTKAGVAPSEPSLTIFRAIFLGFYRHGVPPGHPGDWTYARLNTLFNRFIGLSEIAEPKQMPIFWIIISFWRTSGGDAVCVQRVIRTLDERFGMVGWSGRLVRLREMIDEIVARGGEATREELAVLNVKPDKGRAI